ncbi:hypothetical protein [Vibrio owensii]|uniref:hypothetical protein n=1 Tax=Vibrio owensii TaxID=696485 RepID=UPI0018F18E71|nr:hypothetical protein [Vibrio owensii]
MKYLKSIVFVLLGVFSLFYLHVFREVVPESDLSLIDGIVTTFVSTLLSIIVGIYLFEYQQKENRKSEHKRLVDIVTAESKDIISILSDDSKMVINLPSGKSMSVLITLISPLAHEEAGKSGEFDALITENLFHISRKIRMYNMKVEHLLGLIRSNSSEAFLEHAIENVNQTTIAVIDGCNLVSAQVNQA